MDCRTALLIILDQVDYTAGNCRPNEMVGAVLSKEIIALCREAAQQSVQSDLATASAQNDDWLNEPMCKTCGHSKSRHNTAGGFCKHCTCNEFVEPATPPNR